VLKISLKNGGQINLEIIDLTRDKLVTRRRF